ALLRLLSIRTAPWPLTASSGIALLLAFGGVLNLTGYIVAPVLVSLVIIGDVLALWGGRGRVGLLHQRIRGGYEELTKRPRNLVLGTLLGILLVIPVFRYVRVNEGYLRHDDVSGYVNFPVETIQLGTLPSDPFNERRITSGLGGPYFLQALILPAADVRSVPFIDVSVGFVLYAAVLFGIFRSLKLSLQNSLCLVLLIFVAPLVRPNLTMAVLPAALFASLFWIEIHPALGERAGLRRSVLLGLTVAALCSLKSNYLPPALLIGALFYFVEFLTERRLNILKSAMLFAFVVVCSLLPWMIDMKQKEATYLFPILGPGYHASAYGVIPLPSGSHHDLMLGSLWMWLAVVPLAGPIFLALAAAFIAHRQQKIEAEWTALCSVLLGTGLGILAIAASTGGASMGRYSLPFEVPAMLIFAAFVLHWRKQLVPHPLWLKSASVLVIAQLLYHAAGFGVYSGEYRRAAQEAGLLSLPKRFDLEAEKRRIAALQKKVPPGERVLTHLSVSSPFDFKRNRVFIADWIGMAGLPPGMPVTDGPDALRTYLLNHSIRYVAYDPRRLLMIAQFDPATSLQTLLAHPQMYGRQSWLFVEAKVSEEEERNIAALAKTYSHVFDDGAVYLLDLKSRSPRKTL
ncbi:MAG: hypothetical protein ACJ74Z_12875, partial [Bryobacteraceae bacterium]